jgi:hypothetical protein
MKSVVRWCSATPTRDVEFRCACLVTRIHLDCGSVSSHSLCLPLGGFPLSLSTARLICRWNLLAVLKRYNRNYATIRLKTFSDRLLRENVLSHIRTNISAADIWCIEVCLGVCDCRGIEVDGYDCRRGSRKSDARRSRCHSTDLTRGIDFSSADHLTPSSWIS